MQNTLFSLEKKTDLFDIKNDYVLFEIAELFFAIKLLDIKEIVSNRNIVEVDDLPNIVKGFANIRNNIFPVFDIKKGFALENIKKYGKYSIIIIIEDSDESLALLADSVLDIYNFLEENFVSYNLCDNEYCKFVDYTIEFENKEVKIINTEKLIKLKYQI